MIQHNSNLVTRYYNSKTKGSGIVNKLIDKLPVELHIPFFRFCGPGTHLHRRLARGDTGINPLDEACKEHDIAYSQFQDINKRHEADKVLAQKALQRVKATDASLGEKVAALGVAGVMKAKTKLGMGMRKTRRRLRHRKVRSVAKVGMGLRRQKYNRRTRRRQSSSKQRIIPIPKSGGFLPFLLPLLGTLGALGGGAAGIAKAVNDAKTNRQLLAEQKRHNVAMENTGKGLYLRPYKKGTGLYLKPYTKNFQ